MPDLPSEDISQWFGFDYLKRYHHPVYCFTLHLRSYRAIVCRIIMFVLSLNVRDGL